MIVIKFSVVLIIDLTHCLSQSQNTIFCSHILLIYSPFLVRLAPPSLTLPKHRLLWPHPALPGTLLPLLRAVRTEPCFWVQPWKCDHLHQCWGIRDGGWRWWVGDDGLRIVMMSCSLGCGLLGDNGEGLCGIVMIAKEGEGCCVCVLKKDSESGIMQCFVGWGVWQWNVDGDVELLYICLVHEDGERLCVGYEWGWQCTCVLDEWVMIRVQSKGY